MDSVSKLETRSRQEEDGPEAPSALLITGSTIGIALAHCLAEESSTKEIWLTWRTKKPEVYSDKNNLCADGRLRRGRSRCSAWTGRKNSTGLSTR